MRTHKKYPRCEICSRPVSIAVAMSDAEGNKAHIYCVVKLNGLWRLTNEANKIQENTSRKTKVRPNKTLA